MTVCTLCKNNFRDYQGLARARCGPCNTKIRRYRVRSAAIEYLGKKCVRCGFQGEEAVFQFHRKNAKRRDFSISSIANRSWEEAETELEKCILLCANCHALKHWTEDDRKVKIEAKKYRGKKLKV